MLITHAVGKETDPIAWQSHALKYDYLVLALGGETNFFGMTEVSKYAFTMKSIDDALILRNHVINMLVNSRKEIKSDSRSVHRSLLQTRTRLKTFTVERSIKDRTKQIM